MTGLRERMKNRRRESVLIAAEKLFHDNGYTKTTIEDIATQAEVSIGTLYKYFGSKGGVMHELVQPVIEEMRAKGLAVIENPPEFGEDAIAEIFDAYRFNDDWKSLNLLQAFEPGFTGMDTHLHSVLEEFEEMIEAQLTQLVKKLMASGKLNSSFKAEDIVFILFHHLYAHFLASITSDGTLSYEQTLINMRRRLSILFDSWL